MFDYSKLRGLMAEKRVTQKDLANLLEISENAVSKKMNGDSAFTSREIAAICNYLDIPNTQIGDYFFVLKV